MLQTFVLNLRWARALLLGLMLGLAACSDDSGITESGGGSQSSDGGAQSAKFAGNYNGTLTLNYVGDGIDADSKTYDAALIVTTNGLVQLTVDGTQVNGVINNNKVSLDLKITHKETGVSCKGTAVITCTANGTTVAGPVSGQASCTVLLVDKRNATLSGNLTVSK